MIITEILEHNARIYSENTALIERDPGRNRRVTLTWKAFDRQADRLAQALIALGITKGDRVVELMTNCIEWLPIYFGILRTGAWAVPLNFRFDAAAILRCTALAEAKVMIFGPEFIDHISEIKKALDQTVAHYIFVGQASERPAFALSYTELIQQHDPVNPHVDIAVTDEAALYFTSGTTGTPKAALLTHRNLESACLVENHHHQQTRDDNFLCIPPLYHTGAKMHWFGNFMVGARAVILKGVEPRWILEAVSEEKVTIVWLLVPWAQDILLAIECGDLELKDYDLDQWRLMHIGAQPVPPSLVREWRKAFPHHQYDTNYGLTESTGPGCIHLGIGNEHKVGAIGKPGFDWEFQIVNDLKHTVPHGEPGELIVKGPGVMKEYYKHPEATADALHNGWLLTGDIARMDEDGFIWLVDRKKDIIITGGENVYPVEIEDFLQAHPHIQDAAVIGLPCRRLGEIVTAVVQIKPGRTMTEEDIHTFCEPLPRYKRPRKIVFADVPRNPTGKIEKPKLRKSLSGAEECFRID
jgi:acyl-CoA synthetase (AMP-forming)/AMP-acid ligase II